VDGEEIGKVRDTEIVDSTMNEIKKDLEKYAHLDLVIESEIDIEASKAKDKEISSEDELYEKLKSDINYSLLGYSIKIDGTTVGIVDSEESANDIVQEVKDYFTKIYDQNSIIDVTTIEDVQITQSKVSKSDLKDPEDIVKLIINGTDEEQKYIVEEGDTYWTIAEYFNMSLDDLISANPTADPDFIQIGDELNLIVPKPFLTVQVKRIVVQEEKTKYDTQYEYVSYMYNDEEVVEKEGSYGVSTVESVVTEQNGIQIAKEIVSEEIISEPTTEVVLTGTQDPPPKKGTGYFINPLAGSTVSSPFGSRSGGFHMGEDLAKAIGSSIQAADGGTVTFAGWSGTYGLMIEIDHGGGYTTRYAHCKELYVSAGEKVYQGKVIAVVGMTGETTGPHLHFEVRKYGVPVNPASYINTQYG
jgi:murein DD-endopeptidase MepM/ murein hydrolase activator NlpD